MTRLSVLVLLASCTTTVSGTPGPTSTTLPPMTSPAPAADSAVAAASPLPGQQAAIVVSRNEGEGLGSIEIPKLGILRYMFEGVQLSTLDQGPGHWPGTAMPGDAGNVVLAGHRTSHNADFADLDELEPGDEVIFETTDGRHVYSVESTEIVEPSAMSIADQTAKPTATLFACHPPGSVSQRIVVHLLLKE